MSDDNTSIGPPPRRPAPREVAPPKVRTGMTVPPGGGLRAVEDLRAQIVAAAMPAVVVPPPMPRGSARDGTPAPAPSVPRASDDPTAVDGSGSAAVPGTFGGVPSSASTSVERGAVAVQGTDRGLVPAHYGHDTGDAPQLGGDLGTHGGEVTVAQRRGAPAWALFMAPALVVGLGGSGAVWAFASRQAAPSDPASVSEAAPASERAPAHAIEPTPAREPAVEPALAWLAAVNEVDPARVLPWTERHARLDRLAGTPEAAWIDRHLNLALDLLQAGDAPSPCESFAAALDAVEAAPRDDYVGALSGARAPTGSDPACEGLETRRASLLATLGGTAPPPEAGAIEEPPPTPEVDAAADSKPREATERPAVERPRPIPKPKSTPKNVEPSKPKDRPPVGKLDEELRPFGG